MLKKLLLSVSAVAAVLTANARQLTPEESLTRLKEQAATGPHKALARAAAQLSLAHTSSTPAGQTLYIYDRPAGGGFLILGADDLVPALLGYTDSGHYDPNNLPDGFRYWLECLDGQISAAISQGVSLAPAARAAGSNYAPIEPLVTAKWGQGDEGNPFWEKCPVYGGEHAVVGCVATAMAQVMYKHKWPERGTGAKAGLIPSMFSPEGLAITLVANFGDTEYHWDRMQDCYGRVYTSDNLEEYEEFPYTKESGDAVALLSFHCGVSVDMAYGTPSYGGGSGAVSQQVPSALYRYFGYDAGMSFENRDCYTDAEWIDMLYTELQAERPLYYSGRNAESGHAFVLDGYRDGLFHVNWGWHGMCNGYFSILGNDALTPIRQGTGGSNAGYALQQGCITGVQPARPGGHVRPNFIYDCPDTYIEGIIESNSYGLFGADGELVEFYEPNQEYLFYGGAITSQSNDEIDCTIGLKFVNTETGATYYTGHPLMHVERYPICGFQQDGIPVTTDGVPPGEYFVYPAVLQDGDDEWVDMKLKRTTRSCRIQIVGEGSNFIPKPNIACSGFKFDKENTHGNHVEVLVENLSNYSYLYPFSGDIMLVLRDSHGKLLEYVENATYTFSVDNPLPAGSYDDQPIRIAGDIQTRLKPGTNYTLEMVAYNTGETNWNEKATPVYRIELWGDEEMFISQYASFLTLTGVSDDYVEAFGNINYDSTVDVKDLEDLVGFILHDTKPESYNEDIITMKGIYYSIEDVAYLIYHLNALEEDRRGSHHVAPITSTAVRRSPAERQISAERHGIPANRMPIRSFIAL